MKGRHATVLQETILKYMETPTMVELSPSHICAQKYATPSVTLPSSLPSLKSVALLCVCAFC